MVLENELRVQYPDAQGGSSSRQTGREGGERKMVLI